MEIIFSYLQSGLSAVVPFILLLGILVFVHELGHFLVAIWCGVKVETFSLGFGKKLLQHKRGDTVYAISMIPLGGYVKMYGESPQAEIPEDQKTVSFTHKTVWQRIAIVIAGPLMNFFFAIFIFATVAMIGEDAKAPIVGDVFENSYAYQIGFRSGDRIYSADNIEIQSWDQFQKILNKVQNKDLNMIILRSGEKLNLSGKVISKENPNPLSLDSLIGEVDGLTNLSKAPIISLSSNSPLIVLGLKTGDVITSINSKKVSYWRELSKVLESISETENLNFEIMRFSETGKGEPEKLNLQLAALGSKYSLESLGIESSELYIGKVMKSSPAEAAGVKDGDKMISVNNNMILKWDDVITFVKAYDGKNPLKVVVSTNGTERELQISPQITSITTSMGAEEKRYAIGVSPLLAFSAPEITNIKTGNPLVALTKSLGKTWDISVMTIMGFVRLFEGRISSKHIGGVISIGQAAQETFKVGISQFLSMMAVISINLFILNLLPIPVLDGGHLVFYTLEVFNGGPVSLRKMEIAQQVGMILLLSLMVFSLFNDFSRLFGFMQ